MTGVPDKSPWREQLIAAVVPETVFPHPLAAPLPALPSPVPSNLSRDLLTIGRPDRSGRVVSQSLLRALAWQPGDRIIIDVSHGTVVVRLDSRRPQVIGPRGEIPVPAAVRTMAGLAPHHPVLLAALIESGLLVIHPLPAIAHLLARLHRRIEGKSDYR